MNLMTATALLAAMKTQLDDIITWLPPEEYVCECYAECIEEAANSLYTMHTTMKYVAANPMMMDKSIVNNSEETLMGLTIDPEVIL